MFRQLQSCATQTLKQSCLYHCGSTVSKQDYLKIKSFFSLNRNLLRMPNCKIHFFEQLNVSCNAGIFIYQIQNRQVRSHCKSSKFLYIEQGIVSLQKYVLIARIVSRETAIPRIKKHLNCPYCEIGLKLTIAQKVNNVKVLLNWHRNTVFLCVQGNKPGKKGGETVCCGHLLAIPHEKWQFPVIFHGPIICIRGDKCRKVCHQFWGRLHQEMGPISLSSYIQILHFNKA